MLLIIFIVTESDNSLKKILPNNFKINTLLNGKTYN